MEGNKMGSPQLKDQQQMIDAIRAKTGVQFIPFDAVKNMEPTSTTIIPVHPCTNVRVLQSELWMMGPKISDEYLAKLDQQRVFKINKKTGLPFAKPGGYLARKKYIETSFLHKKEIKAWVERTGFVMPHGGFAVWFYMPMPRSWRPSVRKKMMYQAHQGTPDIDNLFKQLADGIMPRKNRQRGDKGCDDRKIHCYATFKIWVPFEESCIKIVHYDPEAFNYIFRHGHPGFKQ